MKASVSLLATSQGFHQLIASHMPLPVSSSMSAMEQIPYMKSLPGFKSLSILKKKTNNWNRSGAPETACSSWSSMLHEWCELCHLSESVAEMTWMVSWELLRIPLIPGFCLLFQIYLIPTNLIRKDWGMEKSYALRPPIYILHLSNVVFCFPILEAPGVWML